MYLTNTLKPQKTDPNLFNIGNEHEFLLPRVLVVELFDNSGHIVLWCNEAGGSIEKKAIKDKKRI